MGHQFPGDAFFQSPGDDNRQQDRAAPDRGDPRRLLDSQLKSFSGKRLEEHILPQNGSQEQGQVPEKERCLPTFQDDVRHFFQGEVVGFAQGSGGAAFEPEQAEQANPQRRRADQPEGALQNFG